MSHFTRNRVIVPGFSGASTSVDFEDKIFIKCDVRSSETLEYQYQIQKEITKCLTGKLKTPKVIELQVEKDHSSLSMEYLEGQTLHELFESGDHKLASEVLNILWNNWKNINWKDKLVNIQTPSQISNLDYSKKLITILESAKKLNIHNQKIFETLWDSARQINLPKAYNRFCHGDMNFENIIYSNGNVYLYDFIRSPFPCLEQDLSKIIQDGIGGWCFRKTATGNSLEPYMITRNLVLKAIKTHNINIDLTKKLSYLSCLRIIPYIKKNTDCFAWLNVANKINNFFEKQI